VAAFYQLDQGEKKKGECPLSGKKGWIGKKILRREGGKGGKKRRIRYHKGGSVEKHKEKKERKETLMCAFRHFLKRERGKTPRGKGRKGAFFSLIAEREGGGKKGKVFFADAAQGREGGWETLLRRGEKGMGFFS